MPSLRYLIRIPFIGFIIGFLLGKLSGNMMVAFATGFFGVFIHMMVISKPRFHVSGEKGEGFLKSEQDYLKNIIALAALVIRSDGKDAYHELSFIEARLRKEFSPKFVPVAMSHMRAEVTRPSTLKPHTDRIASEFDNPAKIQLMHFLISICTVDGVMTQNELNTLRDISMRIELSQKSLDAIISMFRFRNEQQQQQYSRTNKVSTSMLDDAYKIIGVNSTAGNAEIKKAYKKLAIAHHPDKFAHQGDHAQKAAAEKFKVIAGAYDLICKKRGIV